MPRKLLAAHLALPLAIAGGSACAMTVPRPADARCAVQRAQLLPAEVGGAKAVCDEIRKATTSAGTGPIKVIVTVHSSNELSAQITNKQGRSLPELRFAKSDRPLSRASVGRFARTIAEVAGR